MLLGRNDKERQSIDEFLVKSYNLRNSIVHGSESITSIQIDKQTYEMEDIIVTLREYLRESIKRLMQLHAYVRRGVYPYEEPLYNPLFLCHGIAKGEF